MKQSCYNRYISKHLLIIMVQICKILHIISIMIKSTLHALYQNPVFHSNTHLFF